MGGDYGAAHVTNGRYSIHLSRNQSADSLLSTLLHEMWHVGAGISGNPVHLSRTKDEACAMLVEALYSSMIEMSSLPARGWTYVELTPQVDSTKEFD